MTKDEDERRAAIPDLSRLKAICAGGVDCSGSLAVAADDAAVGRLTIVLAPIPSEVALELCGEIRSAVLRYLSERKITSGEFTELTPQDSAKH